MNRNLICIIWILLVVVLSTSSIYAYEENTLNQTNSIHDKGSMKNSYENLSSIELIEYNSKLSKNLSINMSDPNPMNKNITELISVKNDIYYHGKYSVILRDSNTNKLLSDKKINFVIKNMQYSNTSDINGIASIQIPQIPGKYEINAFFEGDETHSASNLLKNINILNTIQSNDITKYYNGNTLYTATFFNSNGGKLTNTDILITIDSKSYTVKTNNNGIASLPINLKPNSYKVVAQDPITGLKLTTTFKILSTIAAKDIKKVYFDNKKFTAKFLKNDGTPLKNNNIKYKLKGKTYKVKTNKDGVVKISVQKLKKGTHTIILYNHDGLEQKNTIKVYRIVSSKLESKRYTFLKHESKKIKVKLLNSLGYPPLPGKIIKFMIKGNKYYKKTNKNGIAKLKLPKLKKGVYNIKYSFSGTSCYKSSNAQNKIEIITTKNPKFSVKSKTFIPNSNKAFEIKLTASKVPLEKRIITFNINGEKISKTTNKKGIASIPIKLDLGRYKITYSINKENKINAKSDSCTIEVKQKEKTSIQWKSNILFSPGKKTLKVLLLDDDGKAISSQKVKLKIKSKTYSAKTTSNGYAKFNLKLTRGNYKINVKYDGNSNYYSSSVKKSINVVVPGAKNINDINTISNLKAYLKPSRYCQVGDAKIKELVNKIISGYSSKEDKAKALFSYVRDTIYYDFYFNSQYGALRTLVTKNANCVDHSHLLVAMFRTAGLHARYVHGTCKFKNNKTYGHVWSQVLIKNKWIVADPTSSKNSLGKINNWNTKTFIIHSKSASIPF